MTPESTLRQQIDALDDVIIGLLHERAVISHRIQDQRLRSGGPKVDLSRERDVIGNYVVLLGERGRSVAATVLEFCRGRGHGDIRDEREGQALPRVAVTSPRVS